MGYRMPIPVKVAIRKNWYEIIHKIRKKYGNEQKTICDYSDSSILLVC